MPNNNAIYNAVIAGVTGGGQTRWINQPSSSYGSFVTTVLAIATAVDSLIPNSASIAQPQARLMEAICSAVFEDRFPISSGISTIAQSIVNLYNAQVANLLSEGSSGSFSPVGTPQIGYVVGWDGTQPIWEAVPAAFTITGFGLTGSSLVLVGAAVTNPGFSASYNQAATAANLTDSEGNNDALVLPATAFISPHSVTKNVYGSVWNFTLHASSPLGAGTAGAGITWGQNVYFGSAVDPGVYNSAFATSLGLVLKLGAAGMYAYNTPASQSAFIIAKASFGLTTANFTVGGFPFACSKVATANVTNANAITESFDFFRSDNTGLGVFNLVEA